MPMRSRSELVNRVLRRALRQLLHTPLLWVLRDVLGVLDCQNSAEADAT